MTPFEVLDELKIRLEDHSIVQQDFENVYCIHQNELSTLVPETLFDENHLADYLKFNAKILKSDFLNYDTVESSKSVNVYVPLVNVNNYIFDSFGSFVYKHASTVLIDAVLNLPTTDTDTFVGVHVGKNHFEMILCEKRKLRFYNTFEYTSTEDFIYYILFSVEQLELDPEKINFRLFGNIDEKDDLFEMVYTYIRHVEIIKLNTAYRFADSISTEDKKQSFIVLNSFDA